MSALSNPALRGLVARLEEQASEKPFVYGMQVAALAAAGYAFVAVVVAGGALLTLWALTQMAAGSTVLAICSLMVGASIVAGSVHAVWVRSRRVEGFTLARRDAPPLFALIDKLQKKTEGPPVHRVVIDGQMTAGISQRARLGVLGWYENTLHIGLPFALSVDPRGLAAILAHEYGHLSRARGKWSAWIYRTRRNWGSIGERVVAGGGYFAMFLARPFGWYWPLFDAYSFVLARQHEFEADRLASSLVGGSSLANALVAAQLAEDFLDTEFWPAIYRQADRSASITRSPYREMRAVLRRIGAHPRARQWAIAAIGRPATIDDTHPALRDRLDAMSQRLALPAAVERSAAKALLGRTLDVVIDQFDRQWRDEVRQRWKARHDEAKVARMRLNTLTALLGKSQATVDEQFEYAGLVERFENWRLAAVAYQNFIDRAPKDPRGHFALGRLLVQNDDDQGFDALKMAAKLGDDFAIAAAHVAIQPLQSRGRVREAGKFRQNAERVRHDDRDFLELAALLSASDSFAPHGLTSAEYYHVEHTLRRQHGVTAAYIARKHLAAYSGRAVLVLAIRSATRYGEVDEAAEPLRQKLALPCPVLVFDIDDKRAPVVEAIAKVASAQII